jgi:hypothetical protein
MSFIESLEIYPAICTGCHEYKLAVDLGNFATKTEYLCCDCIQRLADRAAERLLAREIPGENSLKNS